MLTKYGLLDLGQNDTCTFQEDGGFDLPCMAMGMPIGAGILAAFLYGAEPLAEPLQIVSKVLGG